MNIKKNLSLKAFTLVELSISLVIVSLLMAGVFSMAIGSIVDSKNSSTVDKINTIYKNLGIYLANNKRLPCPASLHESINSSANFGQEVRPSSGICGQVAGVYSSSSSNNLVYGMVPINSLNLSPDYAIDEFGNKISYIIDQRFTGDFIESNINVNAPSFGTAPSTSIMTVKERQLDGSSDINLTQNAILIILSHGSNGLGAFNANDATQNSISSDAIEAQNSYFPSYDNIFYSESLSNVRFDDIILYKTRADFVNDFAMQNLIPCYSTGITDPDFTPNSIYYGQYLYASSDCNSQNISNLTRKTIKCGPEGVWQWIVQNCPTIEP